MKESVCYSNLEAAATKLPFQQLKCCSFSGPRYFSNFTHCLFCYAPEPSKNSDYSASLPFTQWLVVRLAKQLSPYSSFCCKKNGTIIDRKGGNILQALSFARHSLPDITEESRPQKGGTKFPDEQELATVEELPSSSNN